MPRRPGAPSSPGIATPARPTDSMLAGIDHVVLAVEDPEAAATTSARSWASTRPAAAGMRRWARSTGSSGWATATSSWSACSTASWPHGAGWVRPCSRRSSAAAGSRHGPWPSTTSTRQLTLAPPDAGLVGPLDGERRRDDGRVVRWRLAHPPALTPDDAVPDPARPGRRGVDTRRARPRAPSSSHPLGGRVRLAGIEVATETAPRRRGTPPTPPRDERRAGRSRRRPGRARRPGGPVRPGPAARSPPPSTSWPTSRSGAGRSVMLGDCEVRLSGIAVAAAPPAGDDGGSDDAPRRLGDV